MENKQVGIGGRMRIETIAEFVALAQVLNYRVAAGMSFVSKPTLSKHIKELEDELGTTLFDRGATSVCLTEDGAKVLEHAEALLASYDRMRSTVNRTTSAPLVVGVPLKYPVWAELFTRVLGDSSNTNVRIVDTGTTGCLDDSFLDELDILLTSVEFASERLNTHRPIMNLRLCVWVSETNLLANKGKISLSELKGMVYRPVDDGSGVWTKSVVTRLRQHGLDPTVGQVVNDWYYLGHDDYAVMIDVEPTSTFGLGAKRLELEEEMYANFVAFYKPERVSDAMVGFLDSLEFAAKTFSARKQASSSS